MSLRNRFLSLVPVGGVPIGLTMRALAFLIVLGLAVTVIYRMVFLPGNLRQEAAEARQNTKAAQGTASMTETTLEAVQQRSEYREVIRETVRTNEHEILSAPGASNTIPTDVHDAGIAALRRLREQADQRDGPSAGLHEVRP